MDGGLPRITQTAKRRDREINGQESTRKKAKRAAKVSRRAPQTRTSTSQMFVNEHSDTSPPRSNSKSKSRRKWLVYAKEAIESLLAQEETEDIDEYQLAILKRSMDQLQLSKARETDTNKIHQSLGSRQARDLQVGSPITGSAARTLPRRQRSTSPARMTRHRNRTHPPIRSGTLQPFGSPMTPNRATRSGVPSTESSPATSLKEKSKTGRTTEDTSALAAIAFPVGQPRSLPAAQRNDKTLSTAEIARLSSVHPSFDKDKTDRIDRHIRSITRQSVVEGAFGAMMGRGGAGAKVRHSGIEKVKDVRDQIRVPSSSPESEENATTTARGVKMRTPGRDVESMEEDRESDRGLFWDGFVEEEDSDIG